MCRLEYADAITFYANPIKVARSMNKFPELWQSGA